MMTEAEAKKKWCPRARITAGVHEFNPISHGPAAITNRCDTPTMTDCLASECMAWRWEDIARRKPIDGYCGLAGKP